MNSKFSRRALTVASVTVLAAAGIAAGSAWADTQMQQGAGAQESTGAMSSDSALSSKVSSAIVQDEKISHLPIHVTTDNGVVQLSGFANSAEEADRAAQVARQVPGVKDVQNNIELQSGQSQQSEPSQSPAQPSRPGY
jgi:hyperosmotically inducible protein